MRRYQVLGQWRYDAITAAIRASGCSVLKEGNPRSAPFELQVALPTGESIDLLCYAFTANKYLQGKRPEGEHRFQVKYGSDFKNAHKIYIDPSRNRVSLFFGIHQTLPLFVAVDPAMHETTWFSRSVEFKEPDLDQACATGWHGWERERSRVRRRVFPNESLKTETLFAFRPEHFARYALFERLATGMDPGERLRLIDEMGGRLNVAPADDPFLSAWRPAHANHGHELLKQFGLSSDELLDLVASRFRLLAAVRGSVAELHLRRWLERLDWLTDVTHIDVDGEPDFDVRFGGRRFRIECKNVLRRRVNDQPKVDFQKTRASKNNPCSRYYERDQFEILAACLHPLTSNWEFRFCATSDLAAHRTCPGRLSERVVVTGPIWTSDLRALLVRLSQQ